MTGTVRQRVLCSFVALTAHTGNTESRLSYRQIKRGTNLAWNQNIDLPRFRYIDMARMNPCQHIYRDHFPTPETIHGKALWS
jgi:hypothetical protein